MKTLLALIILFGFNYKCFSQTYSDDNPFGKKDTVSANRLATVQDTSLHTGSMMDIIRRMNEGIDSLKMTGNADKDYADLMIIHHKTAIDMAEMETSFGEHLKVARKAEQIAVVEKKEIIAFAAFTQRYFPTQNLDSFRLEILPVVKSMQHTTHITPTIDNQFIEMMIVHHKGAIDISKLYLKYAKDVKLKALARSIIKANQLEIPKLKSIKPD